MKQMTDSANPRLLALLNASLHVRLNESHRLLTTAKQGRNDPVSCPEFHPELRDKKSEVKSCVLTGERIQEGAVAVGHR